MQESGEEGRVKRLKWLQPVVTIPALLRCRSSQPNEGREARTRYGSECPVLPRL
eukprot:CAMPEP_0197565044 /NCGR_PEP_ID=MMETSP1320-20131121/31449_1 /TAXON_ID=91990 /ORGANISM="Bolidomonas sp., Strain RCC2347" /LENGTH=53 /DNA_ID=CAMNT_0043127001 /DNA_START=200 /DNA_END=358 /DNA_ORIENTATION=+